MSNASSVSMIQQASSTLTDMASRVRQSTAGPSQRQPAVVLPPYEAPSFSLSPSAQRALAGLLQTHSLKKLDGRFETAEEAITLSASQINDRLYEKDANVKRRRAKGEESPEQDGLEQSLEELRVKTERMTQRMEESMRKIIDGRHSLKHIEAATEAVASDARAYASTQASTQHRSQHRRRDVRNGAEDEESSDDAEYDEPPTPTDPNAGPTQTQNQPPPIDAFRKKLENEKIRYQSFSLTKRYAEDNDYRQFRKIIHDAQNPEDQVPLPHHSEWFNEGPAPQPGVTTRAGANAEDDDDDDIAISRSTISTKCPLTLQEFKNPLTSKRCPHSFESEAILSMIGASTVRLNNSAASRARGGDQAVQCPVSGCQEQLTRADLHTDAILARKIQRIQKARELEEEESDEENEPGKTQRAQRLDSDDDDDDGTTMIDDIVDDRGKTPKPKQEPRSTAGTRAPTSTARSNQVVDLGDDDEDEDEEMED